MPEMPNQEFWKLLKPVSPVFQPDALKDVYIAGAVTDDERYYVPITDTVSSRPLWISPQRNQWCDILMAKRAGFVNRHYHPHEVFAYTISGKWGYLEHEWTATAGDFIYETPGLVHTLVSDHPEGVKLFGWLQGPIEFYDEAGKFIETLDVWWFINHYETYCREHGVDEPGPGGRAA